MSDSTLNRFLASGTNAQRLAFTPNPQTPASGPSPTYVWLETDTGLTYAWNFGGSVWVRVGSPPTERTRTVPLAASFTLENPGTASMADSTYGLKLLSPSASTDIRFIRRTATVPSTPWTVIVRAVPVFPKTSTTSIHHAIIVRNSASGKIIIAGQYNNGILVQNWDNYNTFNGNVFATVDAYESSSTPWHRLVNDGTNLTWGYSPDGAAWFDYATVTLAAFIGSVTQLGFGNWQSGQDVVDIFQSFEIA